jgi:thymidylate synthase
MVFDLREGFPLLTTKKMGYKTILRELLWFLSGSTNNKKLQEKNVHIWDQNASKEFLETRGLDYQEGDLGPVYGFQWRHFGAEYQGVNSDYQGKGVDQIKYIIDTIKEDPSSRRLIFSAWNPCDIDKMVLPPCHVMVQFSIDGDHIDAQLYQRSGDMFLGVPFNIASYSFLLHIIGKLTNYKPRYLHHVLGDAHIYSNHLDVVEQQLERVPYDSPKLKLGDFGDIDQITESDFTIEEYQSYSALKTEMIA